MKNLANCTVREFLAQCNKIRKNVANWLELTQIMEIRKTQPKFTDDMTEEERRIAIREQAKENLNKMLDSMLEKHPEETADLLGLMCFVEPQDLDDYKVSEFFGAYNEMINCEEVIDFFTSLVRLVNKGSSGTAKR